jgi:phospholipid/cholesterol/gamma-HCH transport system permease protein
MCALEVRLAGDHRIEITGDVRTADASTLWRTLRSRTQHYVGRLELDLANLTSIDGIGAALLLEICDAATARGVDCVIVNAPEQPRALLALYQRGARATTAAEPKPRHGILVRLGAKVEALLLHLHGPVVFAGELALGLVETMRSPRRANWASVPKLVVLAGADALAIIFVLDFLMGFVIALQATPPLTQFGANTYVADLVGISVTRELVPLMSAIIMSGRSGAAIAAELGTMHVSEEIDALQTMGISPVPYLVLPRILALLIVAPMLVLAGDVAAIGGGMAVAVMSLDMTPQSYLAELRTVLVASDVWTGVVKAVVFAITIGLISCQEGLAARGAAAGVGHRTTATVVTCLFMIVLFDTLLTIIFRALGV